MTLSPEELQCLQSFVEESRTTGSYWKTASAVEKLLLEYIDVQKVKDFLVRAPDVSTVRRWPKVGEGFPPEGVAKDHKPYPCLDPDKMNGAADQNPFLESWKV